MAGIVLYDHTQNEVPNHFGWGILSNSMFSIVFVSKADLLPANDGAMVLQELTDEELLEQWYKGNEKAFVALYRRYIDFVLLMARRYTTTESGAEHVSQEVWTEIAKKKHRIRNFRGWLLAAIKNRAIDIKKAKWNMDVHLTPSEELVRLIGYFDPAQQTLDRDIIDKCLAKINMLPPLQAQVYYLRVIDGLSYKEISLLLNISISTAQSRLEAAKKRFIKYRASDFNTF